MKVGPPSDLAVVGAVGVVMVVVVFCLNRVMDLPAVPSTCFPLTQAGSPLKPILGEGVEIGVAVVVLESDEVVMWWCSGTIHSRTSSMESATI